MYIVYIEICTMYIYITRNEHHMCIYIHAHTYIFIYTCTHIYTPCFFGGLPPTQAILSLKRDSQRRVRIKGAPKCLKEGIFY